MKSIVPKVTQCIKKSYVVRTNHYMQPGQSVPSSFPMLANGALINTAPPTLGSLDAYGLRFVPVSAGHASLSQPPPLIPIAAPSGSARQPPPLGQQVPLTLLCGPSPLQAIPTMSVQDQLPCISLMTTPSLPASLATSANHRDAFSRSTSTAAASARQPSRRRARKIVAHIVSNDDSSDSLDHEQYGSRVPQTSPTSDLLQQRQTKHPLR